MDALITAAGRGTRFKEMTKEMNKCLFELDGKTIIGRSLDILKEKGMGNIYVVTGFDHTGVEKEVGKKGICIYNPVYSISGLLISVYLAMEKLSGKEFMFVTCDSMYEPGLIDELLEAKGDIVLAIEKKECDEEDVKVVMKDGKLEAMGKKLSCAEAIGEFIGIVKFSAEGSKTFYDALDAYLKQGNINGLVADTVLEAQKNGADVVPLFVKNKRIEIDYKEDLEKAKKMFE